MANESDFGGSIGSTIAANESDFGASGASPTFFDRARNLFTNPDFQSLLAGIGARLDPKGAGGALGGAAQQYLNQQALQKTAARTQTIQDRRHADILAALDRVGGITPKGQPGGDTISRNDDGSLKVTSTHLPVDSTQVSAAAPQAAGDYSTAIPAGTPPITSTPVSPTIPASGVSTSPQTSTLPAITPRNEARSFYPFSQALLG